MKATCFLDYIASYFHTPANDTTPESISAMTSFKVHLASGLIASATHIGDHLLVTHAGERKGCDFVLCASERVDLRAGIDVCLCCNSLLATDRFSSSCGRAIWVSGLVYIYTRLIVQISDCLLPSFALYTVTTVSPYYLTAC